MPSIKDTLISLPSEWQLTPVRGKIAYFFRWASCPVDRSLIAHELSLDATGFGLLTGTLSGGIIAIDCDGHIPHTLFKELLGGDIPHTVAFTSGKDGRAQYLFAVPETHWDNIKTQKTGNARDGGMLEFRWNGCQSVLPPSVHPETGYYQWINAPDATEIALLPDTILSHLTPKPIEQSQAYVTRTPRTYSRGEAIPLERCLSRVHRNILEHGVYQGGRHDAAVRLARDLIGASSKLATLGESYDGNPHAMFWDFCARCHPPLPDKERNQIWRSTKSGNFAPSINNDRAFQNCIDAWHRQTQAQLIVPIKIPILR